jgi:hypothetical protein
MLCILVDITSDLEEPNVSIFYIEDGGSSFLQKFDDIIPEYTTSHARGQ